MNRPAEPAPAPEPASARAPQRAPAGLAASGSDARAATAQADATAQSDADASAEAWADAVLALLLFAVDPAGTGVALRAAAGPVRDRWLALLRSQLGSQPLRRLPLHIRDERLLGGLDLAATLQAGRPVALRGLLADSDGGVLLVAMAERLEPGTAARLAAVMDRGVVAAERDGVGLLHAARFGVVALDEGEAASAAGRDGEQPPPSLMDRLAFRLDLGLVHPRDALAGDDGMLLAPGELAAARRLCASVTLPDALLQALCSTAVALGVDSLRASQQALRAARAHAALHGRSEADADDAAVAARLVLVPRATRVPAPPQDAPPQEEEATPPPPPPPPSDAEPPPPPPPDTDDADPLPPGALDDLILQAAVASLPPQLLAQLQAGQAGREAARAAGVAGALQKQGKRGRPVGVRRGEPRGGQRLNVIETLRAAVPWQKLRRRASATDAGVAAATTPTPPSAPRRIEVRADDFHVTQIRQRRETTTIFAVDASGSAALQRLAEAKGAVELLLADCYVRRDKVAVVAFRGRGADLLLPPTRSLVRAKRALSGLPGGGGTPLAAALDAVHALADAARRRGDTPVVVVLTDGRANVALDGTGGRARAEADALDAARRLRLAGAAVLLIDTSPRPSAQAAALAQAMRAAYLPLPQAGAQAVSQAVRAASA